MGEGAIMGDGGPPPMERVDIPGIVSEGLEEWPRDGAGGTGG